LLILGQNYCFWQTFYITCRNRDFSEKHTIPKIKHPVRLAYQLSASSTFLSEQTSHQQLASGTFLSEQFMKRPLIRGD
jgi:hypothetical protein